MSEPLQRVVFDCNVYVQALINRNGPAGRCVTLLKVATVVKVIPPVFVYARDPDDAHYVNLAVAADAKLIVSRDRDLLDLMDASKPDALEFQRRFPSLRILDPVQFIREIQPAEGGG